MWGVDAACCQITLSTCSCYDCNLTDIVCFSFKQDFKSLHPDDQENLQAIIEKDALTRCVYSNSSTGLKLKTLPRFVKSIIETPATA